MSLGVATMTEGESTVGDLHTPTDIEWHMLDKSKFFFLGAAMFSGVSAALYPAIVLKTRQQVLSSKTSCLKISSAIARYEGLRGFYKGFGTSLLGTIPARAMYMGALEVTKASVVIATLKLGLSETTASAIANGAAGLSAAMAAQLVWTPVDVVSQRLMVQGCTNACSYSNGLDAFRKIMCKDGPRGFYRGFGVSILTYAPSNAVWWATYSVTNRSIWSKLGRYKGRTDENAASGSGSAAVAVQGVSAALASGVSAVITMPLDTIKTRLQVMEKENGRKPLTMTQTMRTLAKDGGFSACYRGLGPRWASMSMSATTMITTYEFLKRLSTKRQESFGS